MIQGVALVVGQVGERYATHSLGEIIHFLSFKSGLQFQCKVDKAERAFEAFRLKFIDGAVVVSDEADLPVAAEIVGKIGLNVVKIGYVFALHIEAAEQGTGGSPKASRKLR